MNIFFGDHRQAFTQTIHSNANHDPTIEQLLSKISTMHDHPMDVCFFSFKEFKHIWDLSSLLSNHETKPGVHGHDIDNIPNNLAKLTLSV